MSGLPIVAVEQHVYARSFSAKSFCHSVFECAVYSNDATAFISCQRGITIGITIIPRGEYHRVVGLSIGHSPIILNADIAIVKTKGFNIRALKICIFGNLHFVVNPVVDIALWQFRIRTPKPIEVKRGNAAPSS